MFFVMDCAFPGSVGAQKETLIKVGYIKKC